ncbi:nicotinamidase-related amidase [Streptomyces sp. TLI_185]|nr:nicotinamidase-related amidase [Streptomyces sp. TLI_185]
MNTALALDPTHTALLVMDYQPAILAFVPEGEARNVLLGRMEGAIADVRAIGGTIAYIRVGFTDADWAAIPASNKSFAPLAHHRVMHHEDPAAAIHERLAPQDGDIIVRKIRYGGMSTTDLDQQLRERGITTLIVSGISTSGVVPVHRHRRGRPRLPALHPVRRRRRPRHRSPQRPAPQSLPLTGPHHRHHRAARPAPG